MEYYGDMPYSEELYHYGVLGMKWGVHRKQRKEAKRQRKLERRIDRLSENPLASNEKFRHNGYMAPDGYNRKSNRGKLHTKIMTEYEKELAKHKDNWDGSPSSAKIWKKLNQQYKTDYLKAVLMDAKVPVNKHTLSTAHKIISGKDTEYTRYDKGRK